MPHGIRHRALRPLLDSSFELEFDQKMEIVFVKGAGIKRACKEVLELDVALEKVRRRNRTFGCGAVGEFRKQAHFVLHPERYESPDLSGQSKGKMSFVSAPVFAVYERYENRHGLLGKVFPVKHGARARE